MNEIALRTRLNRWIPTAILGGLLAATGPLQAGGPAVAGNGEGRGAVAEAPAVSSGGAVRAAPAPAAPVRSAPPVQAVSAPRAVSGGEPRAVAPVQGNERVISPGNRTVGRSTPEIPNQTGARGSAQAGNAWTEKSTIAGRNFSRPRPTGDRHRDRPYLYQYYGGYYPIYIDVPVGGEYFDTEPTVDNGYDGGPSAQVAQTDAAATPATVLISPQSDNPQAAGAGDGTTPAAQTDAAGATPAPQPGSPSSIPGMPQNTDGTAKDGALGPDSLVQSVQEELTRRGYFTGKIDAMFRSDTATALRRFQQDNYLAPTGRLNDPTLHALNLD